MKILFDQNISHRVISLIPDVFPNARHVRDFNHQFSTDTQIWKFARDHGFALVTFDSDFNDLATLYGLPPKIIWLRIGNTHTKNLAEILSNRKDQIISFIEDASLSEIACLEIGS